MIFYAKPSFIRKSKAVKYHLSILFGLSPLSVSALCMLDGLVWDQEYYKGALESHPLLWTRNKPKQLKVNSFQKDFLMSSFRPKNQRKILRISALASKIGINRNLTDSVDLFSIYSLFKTNARSRKRGKAANKKRWPLPIQCIGITVGFQPSQNVIVRP